MSDSRAAKPLGQGEKNLRLSQMVGSRAAKPLGHAPQFPPRRKRLIGAGWWGGNAERVPGFARCDRGVFSCGFAGGTLGYS